MRCAAIAWGWSTRASAVRAKLANAGDSAVAEKGEGEAKGGTTRLSHRTVVATVERTGVAGCG